MIDTILVALAQNFLEGASDIAQTLALGHGIDLFAYKSDGFVSLLRVPLQVGARCVIALQACCRPSLNELHGTDNLHSGLKAAVRRQLMYPAALTMP